MECYIYFKLHSVVVVLLLCRVLYTTSDGCSNRSPRWRDFGGNYCFIIEENATLSWIDAVYQCFTEGGSLASFHSEDDAERVYDNVQNRTKHLYTGLWKRDDGTFEWVDKSVVDFTNWYPGEPNLQYEGCTEMYAESGKWNDVMCIETFGYVCSSPKSKGLNKLSPNKACPGTSEDWRDFGGEFCYIIEEENRASPDDASLRCAEAGGSLASFHSFEEISAVVQPLKSHRTGFHIGLRLNTQGEYKWLDGSPLDLNYFDIWHSASQNRKCVAMSPQSGEWFSMPCQYELGYVCSAPKVVTCEEHVAGDRGSIRSPNYPHYYGRNEVCVWYITVPEKSKIFLEFLDFQIENSYRCENDFVTVLDGHEATSPVLGKFCGYGIPNNIRSSDNKMTVILKSDAAVIDFGFYARYETDSCGGFIATDSGVIRSPHYPQTYRENENCTWKITAPENHQVFLRFETFEIEGGYNCGYDSVMIRDGLEPDDPILGKFCGGTVPKILRSSSNTMSITFVSDDSDQRKGFKAIFRAKDISKQKSVETMLQELSFLFTGEKIQAAKENVAYRIVETDKKGEQPQKEMKEEVHVVLQLL